MNQRELIEAILNTRDVVNRVGELISPEVVAIDGVSDKHFNITDMYLRDDNKIILQIEEMK